MAQKLEDRVASLLGRAAHPVVIECTHVQVVRHGAGWPYWIDLRVSENTQVEWRRDRDLPFAEEHDFELAYGDFWPTYGHLSRLGGFNPAISWDTQPELIQQFAFQRGKLWDRSCKYPLPNGMREWQDYEYLIPMGATAEQFVGMMSNELSPSVFMPLCLATKIAETVHHSRGNMDRAVWYAIGKTVSDAATRSSDPEEFWKQFSLYSREMAKMMRCETWPIFETPAGNLPEMTGES